MQPDAFPCADTSAQRHRVFESLGIVGVSPGFGRVLDYVTRYAACDAPVLVWGETGTGKELIARALHYLSPRADKPFVPVNCGAVPDLLFENELFGHAKGAYTDARAPHRGLVNQAQNGTLLLDEVDALSARAQVALLRFLQDLTYRPVGADRAIKADVRVIAACNADLNQMVALGGFRRDLLFRLDVGSVVIPPLRERPEDVLRLADFFLTRFAAQYRRAGPALGPSVRRALTLYAWPGNVRELENAMHRAVILSDGGRLDDLPLGVLAAMGAEATSDEPASQVYGGGLRAARARCLEGFERSYLQWLLGETGGNVSAAARAAGAERRHLGRMIRRLELEPEAYRPTQPASPITSRTSVSTTSPSSQSKSA
ncbi:sigma 54-interacting transcriptional regulator [Falsiroseomonas sp. E2-1-a4]|uniref:sigma 54-interacting transcriptional regulator n=1 Tax=Falsiroseomonas sp. E2-1-a4 TaxID=3239299 RepID=UPI003F332F9C